MHFAKASTTVLSIDNYSNDFNVSFFPNPTKDILNINLGSITETNYTLSLIDINGKEVLNNTVQNPKLIESISVANLSKGIYLGVLNVGDKRITKKVIID
jgi:hypothetical protein